VLLIPNMTDTIIETERLFLRELLPQDDVRMFELDSDPDVHQFVGKRPVENIEQIRLIIDFIRQQYEDNGIGRWAVVEKKSNLFIGWAGLKYFTDEVNGTGNFYELGYRFIKKYWGQGYATEASKAIIRYGFDEMELDSIYAMTDVNNLASKRVLEKSGFRHVNTFDFSGEPTEWFMISKTK